MNIGGIGNRPINIWQVQKRAAETELNKIGREKIKAEPTKEQLEFIKESQERESKDLSNNSLQVPIDWEYIKETINLTKEQKQIRFKQDQLSNDIFYFGKMAAVEDEYQEEKAKIDAKSIENQKKEDKKNKMKAEAIIAKIAKGLVVSPFDIAFANDIAPEKVARAMMEAKKKKMQEGKKDEQFITQILTSMDYKI